METKKEDLLFDEEDILQHSQGFLCYFDPPPQLIASRSFVLAFRRPAQGQPATTTFTRFLNLPFKPNFASVDFQLTGNEYAPNLPRNVIVCSDLIKSDKMDIIASSRRTVATTNDRIFIVETDKNQITFDIFQADYTHPVDVTGYGTLNPPNSFNDLVVTLTITFYLF